MILELTENACFDIILSYKRIKMFYFDKCIETIEFKGGKNEKNNFNTFSVDICCCIC